jgi:Zn-dependent peptidase ImmA (M78 family)/DNA-binding XRE family transcriptional regulator
MNEALITPEIARWARRRSGFSPESLAATLRVTPEQLASWERGTSFPPFAKAQDLAKTLRIPFGYLFLSAPPADKVPIPDLRTIEDGRSTRPSPDFLDLLNEVLVKHDWYHEFAEERGEKPLEFVGSFSISDSVGDVSADMVRILHIDQSLRREARSWDDYLRLLVQNSEAAGLIVMRSGVVRGNTHRPLSLDEFRGFAITDGIAPLVFINARDAKAAQIFTFAHEAAHIWVGQSGISNPDPLRVPQADHKSVEAFCNRVAAEVLVPEREFLQSWRVSGSRSDYARIQNLARHFRVSVPVILRRARDLQELSGAEYFDLVRIHKQIVEELERKKAAEEEPSSGGNFYNNLWARNSNKLTDAILTAARSRSLPELDAARMLGVKASTLPKLFERMG